MHTNVKSNWIGGDLVFYDKNGNEIARFDGTNRKLTVHASAVLDTQQVQRVTDVTITSAQVLALFATPIQLIAAPGANQAVIFEGAMVHKPAGTAYGGIAVGEDLAIKYTNASGAELGQAETTGFLDQTTEQTRYIRPHTAASGVSQITPVANAALVAHMLVGEITTGNSNLIFRLFYRIVPTVLS